MSAMGGKRTLVHFGRVPCEGGAPLSRSSDTIKLSVCQRPCRFTMVRNVCLRLGPTVVPSCFSWPNVSQYVWTIAISGRRKRIDRISTGVFLPALYSGDSNTPPINSLIAAFPFLSLPKALKK
jgi:hypothetical protein